MLNKDMGYKMTEKIEMFDENYRVKKIKPRLFKQVLGMEKEIWLEDHDEDIADEMNLKFFSSYAIVNREYMLGYILFNKRTYNGMIGIDIEDFVCVNMRKCLPHIKKIIELATKELLSRNDVKCIIVNPNDYSRNFIKRIEKILNENNSNIKIFYRYYGGFEPYGYEKLKNI